MGISDVIKKSVLKGFKGGNLTAADIIITLITAALLGLFIYFIYRLTSRNGFYNRGFNKSLASLPVVTAGIMLAMQSNLIISLGMVGALSIVRFRNAVKAPIDLTYLFWSISMGIIVGANLFTLAIILSLLVTVLLFLLDLIPVMKAPCVLVISSNADVTDGDLSEIVKKYSSRAKTVSRNVTQKGTERIIELQIKDAEALVKQISEMQGVNSVNLLSHDGEVRY